MAHTEYLTFHTESGGSEFDGQRDKRLVVKVMGE